MSAQSNLQALWIPAWYNLDTSITVGKVGDFHFYPTMPNLLLPPERLTSLNWPNGRIDAVFYNSLLRPDESHVRSVQITSIEHPEIGEVQSIDTDSFGVYEFQTSNRTLRVEAEQGPGRCYDADVTTQGWAVRVGLLAKTDFGYGQ